MGDWLEFEIMPDGMVFFDGALWTKQEFARRFGEWLETATVGEYEIENLTMNGRLDE